MALTEEQEQMILENMEAFKEFLSKQGEKEEKKENILDRAEQAHKEQIESQNNQSEMESAIKFNIGLDAFVENFKAVLPETTKAIIAEVNKKNYTTEVVKANTIRASLIEAFIAIKQNLDILPQTMKEKAMRFNSLTEDEKQKQSSLFWDVVEVGATHRQLMGKAQALQKANGTNADGGESAHRARFLSLGDRWKRKD